jgi:hypothetical protein
VPAVPCEVPMDTDRNLLFGLLAPEGGLIDPP